jgi:hypothetical protein
MKKYSKKRSTYLFICLIAILLIIYFNVSISEIELINKNQFIFEGKQYEFVKKFESKCKCKNKIVNLYKNETFYLINLNEDEKKLSSSYKISIEKFNNLNQTCDLFKVLKRGLSQNVISFSLYGRNEFYYRRLRNLTKQIKSLYSNYPTKWSMRVYYDRSINESIICDLECNDNDDIIDFCFVEDIQLKFNSTNVNNKLNGSEIHAMKWRWFPLGDSFVNIFMSRDTDNSILMREVNAVNEWLKSNKTTHIMRGKFIYFHSSSF